MLRAGCMAALLMLLCHPSAAMAEIYRWTDDEGGVHFSDRPDRAARNIRKFKAGNINVINNPEINIDRMNRQVAYEDVNGNMVVQGRVNGTPVRFIVDTGASHVVIPPEVIGEAGIDTKGAPLTELQTANGNVKAPAVEIGRLDVANLSMQRVKAVVLRVSPDARTGLLGMSFLSHYQMKVDHENHLLILEKKAEKKP